MSQFEIKTLANALKKAREGLNETQAQFALRIGVTQATISRWEETGPHTGMGRAMVRQVLERIGTKA